MHSIKKALETELKSFEEQIRKNPEGKIPDAQLNRIRLATDTIKNIDKIEMLEDGGMSEYSQRRYSRDGGGSYGGDSYGRSYDGGGSNRGYSRDGGSYDGGMSERRDRIGRYSRGSGGKEEMMEQLGRMMGETEDDRQREVIEKCLRELDRM